MIKLHTPIEILSCVELIATLQREILESRNQALARIEELERDERDILHELERPRCQYKERAKLATQLQAVLAERRKLKDWLNKDAKGIIAALESSSGVNAIKWIDGLLGVARKIVALKEKEILND